MYKIVLMPGSHLQNFWLTVWNVTLDSVLQMTLMCRESEKHCCKSLSSVQSPHHLPPTYMGSNSRCIFTGFTVQRFWSNRSGHNLGLGNPLFNKLPRWLWTINFAHQSQIWVCTWTAFKNTLRVLIENQVQVLRWC